MGLLAVGLLAAGAGLAFRAAGTLNWLERPTIDARFSLRGHERPVSDVVVVGIDNDSVGQLPQFPFSRKLHARVLERLHAAGARLIVYDISFDRPTSEAADLALFEAARRAAPVIFATSLISASGATQVLGGDANLASIGDRAAAASLLPDADGVLRHTLDQVRGLPTIAAATVARLRGRAPSRAQLRRGWIDFPGPPGTVQNISFAKVLQGHFDPTLVRGKVVVVGAAAPVLQDLHASAAGSPMSGPEVQASAIASALSGFPLHSPAPAVTTLLIVVLALLVPLAGLGLETLGVGIVAVAALTAWTVTTQLAFNSGAVIDYSDPLAGLLIGTGGAVALGMWSDSRERRRLRLLFAAGESGVVEQVLHAPGERRLEPTAIIAGYRLEEVVGRGGMGVVYRATQLALERAVAIKLIATEHAKDAVFRERFRSESRIAASIEHANVIPVYEAGEDDGLLFIAMRLVEGIDLAQMLKRTGALEPASVVRVLAQVAGALDAAHAHGLVHRDVKPANVLLTLDEPQHAYLTDFGVAKRMGSVQRVTRVGQIVGTLDYLAPEQIRGEDVDGRADVYALTCLLYRCLTGRTPFPRDSEAETLWAHISASPPLPSRVRPGLPGELDVVIARGMAKDRAERFPTCDAVARACARAVGVALPEQIGGTAAGIADHPTDGNASGGEPAPTVLSDRESGEVAL